MDNILALIIATAILVLIPGPNVALIVANSLQYGTRFGLVTVAGTTAGVAIQLVFVVGGLSWLVSVAAEILTWVRWLGVTYLLYLAIASWREATTELTSIHASNLHSSKVFWRGLWLACINPKTLLFNAALLPQFVVPGSANQGTPLALLAIVFIMVLALGDVLWCLFAAYLRLYLLGLGRLRNRLSACFYAAAGIGLATTSQK